MSNHTNELVALPKLDARIPQWSLDRLEHRECPFCQKENLPSFLRPDQLPVAYCSNCDLWYISCLPPLEEISKLYQGYWFSFRPKPLSSSFAAELLSATDSMKDDLRLNRLSAISGGLKGKRLLEIGCGCGEFLVGALHRGASVFGNDVSREACSFVREKLSFPVWEGALSSSGFERKFGQMDVVVMSDLIEHPVEPLATLESALAVLRPNGLLLMLTPNGGAASSDPTQASQWVGFRVDLEHLQYLSARTISALAARYQCDVEHLETVGYPGLQGIDRLPESVSADADHSLKRRAKALLKISSLAVRMVRAFRIASSPDPRSGTYHLIAILRKRLIDGGQK